MSTDRPPFDPLVMPFSQRVPAAKGWDIVTDYGDHVSVKNAPNLTIDQVASHMAPLDLPDDFVARVGRYNGITRYSLRRVGAGWIVSRLMETIT